MSNYDPKDYLINARDVVLAWAVSVCAGGRGVCSHVPVRVNAAVPDLHVKCPTTQRGRSNECKRHQARIQTSNA